MKTRLWLSGLSAVVIGGLALFFSVAPGIVDSRSNKVDPDRRLPTVSKETRAFRRTLEIVDLHADTLLWQRDILAPRTRGHVDLAALERGNVALQVFSSVTKSPPGQNVNANADDGDQITALLVAQLQPPRTWTSLLELSLYHAQKLRDAVARSNGHLVLIETKRDLETLLARRARGERVTGAMLSIEGLQDIEGNVGNVDRLWRAGFRMAGLTHFTDNDVAGSAHGVGRGGLTPLGAATVTRMRELGMIIDVAHASETATDQVLEGTGHPSIISSHGSVRATCASRRNLRDDDIRAIARSGGVVGIGYWQSATCSADLRQGVIKAILHVRALVGAEHVALGSDWDGDVMIQLLPEELPALTQGLLNAGLSQEEVRLVMGGNALRVLRAALPDAHS
jgi:membrane dipeptidase